MLTRLQALLARLRRKPPADPAEAVAKELRQAEATHDLDRFKDGVLDTDQHSVKSRWG